jgi:hypothetical protein
MDFERQTTPLGGTQNLPKDHNILKSAWRPDNLLSAAFDKE